MHRSHTEIYLHFSWATHTRAKIISPEWELRLYAFLAKKCIELRSPSIAVNGVEDHVHVLLRASAQQSAAKLAHGLKGSSSYMINDQGLAPRHFDWQDGYGAFSVSPHDVEMIARYIRNQKQHHASGTARREWEQDGDAGDAAITPGSE